MNHPLAICQFDFNLKTVIKSKFSTLSKVINCVGVQTFEHSELKFTNVEMLKFHIHLCSKINNRLQTYWAHNTTDNAQGAN